VVDVVDGPALVAYLPDCFLAFGPVVPCKSGISKHRSRNEKDDCGVMIRRHNDHGGLCPADRSFCSFESGRICIRAHLDVAPYYQTPPYRLALRPACVASADESHNRLCSWKATNGSSLPWRAGWAEMQGRQVLSSWWQCGGG